MKIKKVSIVGFKSFMDKLDMILPQGISAVVGPNGCGKSNIVDAIRWAMGEQSAKQLRGRQMEDVIFNGAGDFKPYGMAEVSIIFENGDGSFPGQYANNVEISITRRLYRSGESEYLINNVPCRLKDIQEIFMDTGLGNRAYSIIGQGQIGAIIEQKPEETRAMLEEAAGITKYRKKVEESRRKMEATRANLQRVEDIMGEVERQMRSMKRQAAKARRFKVVEQEIQRLELILNANAYRRLEVESGDRLKSTGLLEQEEMARSAEFSSLQARLETMRLEMEEKNSGISGLRDAYLHSKEKVSRKDSMLESLATEKRMQAEMEGRFKRDKEEIQLRLESLAGEKSHLQLKVEELKKNSAGLEEEIELLEKRLRGKNELLKEARQEYERVKSRLNSGVTAEIGLNQESGYIRQRLGEITDSSARLEKEKNEIAEKAARLTEVFETRNRTREELARKLSDVEEEIFRVQEESDELERQKKGIETELKAAESKVNASESRLSTLRSMTDNFEGYKIGVRTIMKAQDLEARRDGRILGLVADVVQTEPRYEQALEAVLSDRLQYIIVERQKDGKEAVDYLKVRAKGRGSFIPLNDLNGKAGEKFKQNGFPLLRDLVTVPDAYRPLINALLGDTVLVEDLTQAMEEWARNGKNHSLVTPDGDMVDVNGVISGGRLLNTSSGILARKREIRDLEAGLVADRENVERLGAGLDSIVQEIEKREVRLDELQDARSDCQSKINNLDKTIFQLGHELDQQEKLAEKIARELEQKSKEKTRHDENLCRIQSELNACKEKIKQEELYLREKEAELKEIEEEYERFRNDASNVKMDYNLAREEEKGLLREIERIDKYSEEARRKVLSIDEEIMSGQEKARQWTTREEALRQERSRAVEQLKTAEEALNRAEQERNQFMYLIKEEEKKVDQLRSDLEQLREKISTSKLEQSEIRFKMDNLVELIRDKFGCDLPKIYMEYLQEDFSEPETRERLSHQKKIRERLGEVNLTAIQEHEALKERHEFIVNQREDLLHSIDSLDTAIRKINRISMEQFLETLQKVDSKLKDVFPILFNGGSAGLRLLDESKPLESGVLVEVHPPGKKVSHMGLLSGGEKALVAMALLFAIYLIKPSPFCLLDEVDAALDEANVDRFNDLLREIRKYSQIIMVTHNRRSMEIVDRLYGVTMEKAGVSKIVTVSLEQVPGNQAGN